jgi:hypothetical protein
MNESADDFEIPLDARVQLIRDTLTPPYIAILRERAMERIGVSDMEADRLVDAAFTSFAMGLDDNEFATYLGHADIRKVVKHDIETRIEAAQEHRQLEDDIAMELEDALSRVQARKRRRDDDTPPSSGIAF